MVIAEDTELKGSGFKTRTCCHFWLARGMLRSLVNRAGLATLGQGEGPCGVKLNIMGIPSPTALAMLRYQFPFDH